MCEECGMINTDYWQCQCEREVTLRDETAREAAEGKCEHGETEIYCSACMYAANE